MPAVTLVRFRAVRFTAPVYGLEYGLAATRPRPLDPYMNVVAVFRPAVWAGVAAALLAFVVAFAASDVVYSRCGIVPTGKVRQKQPSLQILNWASSNCQSEERLLPDAAGRSLRSGSAPPLP